MNRVVGFLAILLALALAVVHWLLPGWIEGSMNLVRAHSAYEIRGDAQALHDSLFIADLHSDSLLWKRDLLEESDFGHVDLPRLERGNVALQVFSATTKSPSGQNYEENTADSDNITLLAVAQLWPTRTWSSIYERALYQLEKLHDFADRSDGRLVVITSAP
jgi:membrane dipeptidase